MTGRTHDLAAFTALTYIVAAIPLQHISLATVLVAFSANLIGGLTPDIDQPTADLWHRIPAGSIIGRLVTPLLGGHRYISHSLLGVFLFGFLLQYILSLARHVILVDMEIVWWAFMIGYISHLIMDTFTIEGVPWLFPVPLRFGIPPFRFLRIRTGGIIEKAVIFPGLLFLNGYLFYSQYTKFLTLLQNYLR